MAGVQGGFEKKRGGPPQRFLLLFFSDLRFFGIEGVRKRFRMQLAQL